MATANGAQQCTTYMVGDDLENPLTEMSELYDSTKEKGNE